MPQNSNMYRNLSIVLGIIAIIFAVLYFTKPNQTVTETFNDISADSKVCSDKVAAWQAANISKSTISVEAQAELKGILDDCKSGFEDSKAKI